MLAGQRHNLVTVQWQGYVTIGHSRRKVLPVTSLHCKDVTILREKVLPVTLLLRWRELTTT